MYWFIWSSLQSWEEKSGPYPSFRDEGIKTQRGEGTCQRPCDSKVESRFYPWQDIPRACALSHRGTLLPGSTPRITQAHNSSFSLSASLSSTEATDHQAGTLTMLLRRGQYKSWEDFQSPKYTPACGSSLLECVQYKSRYHVASVPLERMKPSRRPEPFQRHISQHLHLLTTVGNARH